MTLENEAAVVANAQAGDERARNELIAEYLPLVYNIVGRALRGHADVDDVVQETMLRALEGLADLRRPDRFRSWLVAVTMNEIRRDWRSKQASVADARVDEVAELADPGADFVDLTIIRLGLSGQRREVAEATRWLDEDDHALLSLWWLEAAGELTRSEVAGALKLPARYVAVRVQRMKTQLEIARAVVHALSAASRCPRLEPVVARWDGVPSGLWRKRISRHVRGCRACSDRRSGLIPAQALLVGVALVPPAAGLLRDTAQVGGGTVGFSSAAAKLSDASGGNSGAVARPGAGHAEHCPNGLGARRPAGHRRPRPRLRPRGAHVWAGGAAVTVAATAISVALGSPHGTQKADPRVAATKPVPMSRPAPHLPPHPVTRRPTASPSRTPAVAARPATTSPPHPTLTPSTAPTPQPAAEPGAVAQVLTVINQARAAHGLPPYTVTDGLTYSAQGHNTAMDDGCGLSHQCPGEAPLGARERAQGVDWGFAGENIGRASSGPEAQQITRAAVNLTQAMLNEQPPDDGHRRNILSSTFTHIGIAVHRDPGGTVWLTQDFSD
ncbi:sigma-70 family RNA polymerase sigma factor [Streptomyces sp. NPDC002676]